MIVADRAKQTIVFFGSVERNEYSDMAENVAWGNKREYVGYHVHMLMYTKEEAVGMWYDGIKAKLQKMNSRHEETLPIQMMDTLAVGKRLSNKRGLRTEEACGDDDTIDDFKAAKMQKIKDIARDPADLLSLVEKNPFLPGGTVAGTEYVEKGKQITKGGGESSKASSVGDSSTSASTSKSSSVGSDDEAERMGAAESLVDARRMIRTKVKEISSKLWKNKTSAFCVLTALVAKMKPSHVDVKTHDCPEKLKVFEGALNTFIKLDEHMDYWTEDTF